MKRLTVSISAENLMIALIAAGVTALGAFIFDALTMAEVEMEESWEVEAPADQPVEVHIAPHLRRTPAADKAPAKGEIHA